jgi:hypothetical protein
VGGLEQPSQWRPLENAVGPAVWRSAVRHIPHFRLRIPTWLPSKPQNLKRAILCRYPWRRHHRRRHWVGQLQWGGPQLAQWSTTWLQLAPAHSPGWRGLTWRSWTHHGSTAPPPMLLRVSVVPNLDHLHSFGYLLYKPVQ